MPKRRACGEGAILKRIFKWPNSLSYRYVGGTRKIPALESISKRGFAFLAERVGFEPTVRKDPTTVFETVPFNRSGTSPKAAKGSIPYARGFVTSARRAAP
jgi:hypothetical protein